VTTRIRLARVRDALIRRSWVSTAAVTAVGCALAVGPAASAAVADGPASTSKWPIPASNSWQRYVEGNNASTVTPVAATAIGNVRNPRALVTGRGVTTLTWLAGQARPIVVLDYGKEVGGLPFFGLSSVTPVSPATSVTMRAGYSEVKQYLLGASASTTLTASASAGDTNIKVASVTNLVAGDPLTVDTGADAESATVAAVGTATATTTLAAAAPAGGSNIKVTSTGQTCFTFGCFGTPFFAAGDAITIGSGAGAESATIQSVGSAGTAGTGLTLTAPVGAAQAAGASVSDPGSGVTLSAPLSRAHATGAPVATASQPVVGDANGNNGVGTDPNRTDDFSLTSASDNTTVGNAVTAVQGGERYEAITLTTPGTLSLSSAGITVKFNNLGAGSYQGYFLSSDHTLNKIWYDGVYTAQTDDVPIGGVCSSTTTCSLAPTILDGAKRDRRPWSGDLSVEGRTLFDSLGFGGGGSDYIKGAIGGFGSSPQSNGSICGQISNWVAYPTANLSCSFYSPTYSMYYPINLAEYYLYSRDTAFTESQYQTMKNELAYNRATVDPTTGLSIASGRDWDFYDGSKGGTAAQGGAVSATNMLYYEALADAGWLAGQLAAQDPGNASAATWSADAATWTNQAAALKAAINSRLFNASRGVYQLSSSDNGTHPATAVPQDANGEAIAFGIAPPDKVPGILAYLKNNLWGTYGPQPYSTDAGYSTVISPFVSGYELDARFASGDTSGALALTNLMWAQMVHRSGQFYTGTLWEKLGQNGQITDSNASLAHGWATAPVSAFSSYLLGVQPTSPGYKTWTIAPQTGNLAWAQGRVPTPSGPIGSRWEARDGSFKLTISAPAGTSGTVAVPLFGGAETIAENGRIVWSEGAPRGGAAAKEADGTVVFSNVRGTETFVSERARRGRRDHQWAGHRHQAHGRSER
jgi:Bacterial alpha-L-rhamnosidase C-terminal domain/Bacterial alpha-L-rhamnosidase 6 hairpin glycosidase domain